MDKAKGPAAGCSKATCGWKALLLPQLNRQSLYVYGSEMAVEKECLRQLQSGVFVIHPFSPLRYLTHSGRHFLTVSAKVFVSFCFILIN